MGARVGVLGLELELELGLRLGLRLKLEGGSRLSYNHTGQIRLRLGLRLGLGLRRRLGGGQMYLHKTTKLQSLEVQRSASLPNPSS